MKDFLHNTPLHIAATKNYISLAMFLIERYPSMLMAPNGQGELPVQTAIRSGRDDVAAFLIRRMDHRGLVNLPLGYYFQLKISSSGSTFCTFVFYSTWFKVWAEDKYNVHLYVTRLRRR